MPEASWYWPYPFGTARCLRCAGSLVGLFFFGFRRPDPNKSSLLTFWRARFAILALLGDGQWGFVFQSGNKKRLEGELTPCFDSIASLIMFCLALNWVFVCYMELCLDLNVCAGGKRLKLSRMNTSVWLKSLPLFFLKSSWAFIDAPPVSLFGNKFFDIIKMVVNSWNIF